MGKKCFSKEGEACTCSDCLLEKSVTKPKQDAAIKSESKRKPKEGKP